MWPRISPTTLISAYSTDWWPFVYQLEERRREGRGKGRGKQEGSNKSLDRVSRIVKFSESIYRTNNKRRTLLNFRKDIARRNIPYYRQFLRSVIFNEYAHIQYIFEPHTDYYDATRRTSTHTTLHRSEHRATQSYLGSLDRLLALQSQHEGRAEREGRGGGEEQQHW